jgi:hypothetical protein
VRRLLHVQMICIALDAIVSLRLRSMLGFLRPVEIVFAGSAKWPPLAGAGAGSAQTHSKVRFLSFSGEWQTRWWRGGVVGACV